MSPRAYPASLCFVPGGLAILEVGNGDSRNLTQPIASENITSTVTVLRPLACVDSPPDVVDSSSDSESDLGQCDHSI